jgi:hypothetical protein
MTSPRPACVLEAPEFWLPESIDDRTQALRTHPRHVRVNVGEDESVLPDQERVGERRTADWRGWVLSRAR